jgi:AcrR family transcriptional regulator
MPRVTQAHRDARRDEIVAAAMIAFRRRGFQAASMADIIAESGLSAGAIYGHFASKSEIITQVASRVVGARVDEAAILAADDDLQPPAHLALTIMRGMLRDLGDAGMIVQLWGEAVTDPGLKSLSTSVFQRLKDVYADYISLWHQREHGESVERADEIAASQVPLFVAVAQGFIVQSALVPSFDAEAYFESAMHNLPR